MPKAVRAGRIAELYRTRWRVEHSRSPGIEGMFGRLEAVLHSEVSSLGHPRAALLGFAAAVLAYNVLALLQHAVEQAHQPSAPPPPTPQPPAPPLEVSCFHLAQHVRSGYEDLLIALPPEHWQRWDDADPTGLAQRLLRLARNINPRQVHCHTRWTGSRRR